MEQLLLMMASMMSMEKLIQDSHDATSAYLADPSEENEKTVMTTSLLLITKHKVNKDGGLEKSMDQWNKSKEAYDIGSRITGKNKES